MHHALLRQSPAELTRCLRGRAEVLSLQLGPFPPGLEPQVWLTCSFGSHVSTFILRQKHESWSLFVVIRPLFSPILYDHCSPFPHWWPASHLMKQEALMLRAMTFNAR